MIRKYEVYQTTGLSPSPVKFAGDLDDPDAFLSYLDDGNVFVETLLHSRDAHCDPAYAADLMATYQDAAMEVML